MRTAKPNPWSDAPRRNAPHVPHDGIERVLVRKLSAILDSGIIVTEKVGYRSFCDFNLEVA